MKKVLIVDDELPIVESIAYNLVKEGFRVAKAFDGVEALELINAEKPDLILLDIMLPSMNGFEVCKAIRKNNDVPIIMLTAKESELDRVVGLEIGADDYVTKPFSIRELIARIKAVLRRKSPVLQESSDEVIRIGDLAINDRGRIVVVRGKEIELSPKEYELLKLLATNPGRVFSRSYLLDAIWGYDYYGDSRTVDVHIRWLREKIEADPSNPRYIITARGVGYRFSEQVGRDT